MADSHAPQFGVPHGFHAERARVAAVKARLLDAGVKACMATFVDVHGVPKAKLTPIESFEHMCDGSELYTVGACEGMGLAGPQEDECATVPDLDSALVLPWDRSKAWFASDLYYHGEPYTGDPRGILRRLCARAADLGFRLNLGVEPEFFVLRKNAEGRLEPITTTRFRGPNACYDVALATESDPFLEPIARYIGELGWGLYSYDQECGRGQYELDFGYTDALTMADRFVFLRFMVKKVAQSIGAFASFMPKPFANDFRNGAHFNMSLADVKTGNNLFAPTSSGPRALASRYGVGCSDLALHFVAGLKAHAAAITAVTCPSYNSYQGLIAQGDLADFSWAPVLIAWGKNNRSAMLRLPGNRHCIENRAVDMSINPYLAAAISLAAGLDGIERKLDPGEPLNDDLYRRGKKELRAAGIDLLPRTLLHALEAFESDPISAEAFGSYKDVYLAHKTREWERSFYAVSDEQR
ncbi:MAG: glutamine synthetase, partial [Polyangiaceae bacterium]